MIDHMGLEHQSPNDHCGIDYPSESRVHALFLGKNPCLKICLSNQVQASFCNVILNLAYPK